MSYKWIITRDVLKEKGTSTFPSEVGVEGPWGCDDRTAAQLPDTFRMYDDDGELYYEGKTDAFTNGNGFEPLDDFGMPNGGCTSIAYRTKTGKYETL